MVNAVIFDVDGTLVDSVGLHARAWQETFQHFGTEVKYEDVCNQIGKGGDHLMPVFLTKEQIKREGKDIEKYRKQLFNDKYMGSVKPFPSVRELFQKLQANDCKIALASSAKGEELQKYKSIANIDDLLDAETSSDDAKQSKPEPDIFEAALERLNDVDRKQVIVIGDSPYDAEAAAKAGLRTIGLLSGGFADKQLQEAGVVAIYRDAAHLLAEYDRSVLSEP